MNTGMLVRRGTRTIFAEEAGAPASGVVMVRKMQADDGYAEYVVQLETEDGRIYRLCEPFQVQRGMSDRDNTLVSLSAAAHACSLAAFLEDETLGGGRIRAALKRQEQKGESA